MLQGGPETWATGMGSQTHPHCCPCKWRCCDHEAGCVLIAFHATSGFSVAMGLTLHRGGGVARGRGGCQDHKSFLASPSSTSYPPPPRLTFRGMCKCVHALLLSCVRLFVTPWTAAVQASLSMGLSRQEYWSGLPFPPPGDLPDPGIQPGSVEFQADSLPSEPPRKPMCGILWNPAVMDRGTLDIM